MRPRVPPLVRPIVALCCVALGAVAPAAALAHGDAHERLVALDEALRSRPRDALLWLERAEAWRSDGACDSALADVGRARALDPALPGLDLAAGAAYLEAGRAAEAEASLTRAVRLEPARAEAWRMRARARLALGRPLAAADDLASALALPETPRPEDFVARAAALRAGGRPDDEALAVLDSGIVRLGSTPALDEAALSIERALGRFDAALARIERGRAWRTDAELALRRGELQAAAGRTLEARAEYSDALARLSAWSPARRARPATRVLERAALDGLARLDAGGRP